MPRGVYKRGATKTPKVFPRVKRSKLVLKTEGPLSDPVNHPSHYTNHPSGIECIEVTRHMTFNVGNVVKYCWRAGLKTEQNAITRESHLQDLKKAQWYINDEIKRLELAVDIE